MKTVKEEFEEIYLSQLYLWPTSKEAFSNALAIWKSKYPFDAPFGSYDSLYRWQYRRKKK